MHSLSILSFFVSMVRRFGFNVGLYLPIGTDRNQEFYAVYHTERLTVRQYDSTVSQHIPLCIRHAKIIRPLFVKARSHMTIGMTTGLQTRCDDRSSYRSSCVNSQIHCCQTGRHTGRKNQTCLILAIRQTTGAALLRSV